MTRLTALDWIALVLVIFGGINWGLVGTVDIDLVSLIFGSLTAPTKIIYILVGIAAAYLAVVMIRGTINDKTTHPNPTHKVT